LLQVRHQNDGAACFDVCVCLRKTRVGNAYHRLLGGSFGLRGAGSLLLPSQPSRR
jgi:hypothetical protein